MMSLHVHRDYRRLQNDSRMEDIRKSTSFCRCPEMYELLKICAKTEKPGNYVSAFLDLKDKARELLAHIDVEEYKHD